MNKKVIFIISTLLCVSFLTPVFINFSFASNAENEPTTTQPSKRDIRLTGRTTGSLKKSLLIVEGYYQDGQLTIDFGGLIANENVDINISTDSGAVLMNEMVFVDETGIMHLYIDLTTSQYLWIEITSANYSFSGEF